MEPVTLTIATAAVVKVAPMIANKIECGVSAGISLLTGLPDVTLNCSLKEKDKS